MKSAILFILLLATALAIDQPSATSKSAPTQFFFKQATTARPTYLKLDAKDNARHADPMISATSGGNRAKLGLGPFTSLILALAMKLLAL